MRNPSSWCTTENDKEEHDTTTEPGKGTQTKLKAQRKERDEDRQSDSAFKPKSLVACAEALKGRVGSTDKFLVQFRHASIEPNWLAKIKTDAVAERGPIYSWRTAIS